MKKFQREFIKRVRKAIPEAKVRVVCAGRSKHDKLAIEVGGVVFLHPVPNNLPSGHAAQHILAGIVSQVEVA